MSQNHNSIKQARILLFSSSLVVAAALMVGPSVAAQVANRFGGTDSKPNLDPVKELGAKLLAPFTLAAVGDLTMMRPIGPTGDPDVQAVLKLVRDSDVGFANLETNVTDPPDYVGPMRGFNAPA